MRKIWSMIRNEFLREFSSPITLVFFVLLPLLFTAAVSTGLSSMMDPSSEDEVEEARGNLYVKQEDAGLMSAALLDVLAMVNLDAQVVEELPEESYGLEVPPAFSERLVAGEVVTLTLHTLPASSGSTAVEQAVQSAQGQLGGAVLVASMGLEQGREAEIFASEVEEREFFREILDEMLESLENPAAIPEVRWPEGTTAEAQANDMVSSVEQGSAGQLVTWVQITLLGAAEVLVDERLRGTLKRMLVMPASRSHILLGKLTARLMLGLLQIAILLVGGSVIFGVGWARAPLAVGAISLAFALATVGLGMLLATFVRSRGQASSVVVGFSMAMAALGGAWWPLEVTPQLYQQVVQALPSTWAMRAYGDVLARGATLVDVLPHIGVLLLFAALFTGAGMWRFKDYE